jgi:hypothetical protein
VSEIAVTVDLEVDFHNEDETGYIWTRLSDAPDPSIIKPGAIVVVADDDDLAMGRIVDLFEVGDRTFVHVDVLPGTIDAYFDVVARNAAATS